MNNYPLISIITINYKQAVITNQLLASLQFANWPNMEVIIVDNDSGINDFKKINTSYKNSRLILSKYNLGFSGGNNIGIREAKGEYILLLNNDTEVDPGFLDPMIDLFESQNDVGAVSPKIKFFHEPDRIQYAGFSSMNTFTLRMNAIGNRQFDDGSYEQLLETHFAHGCAMMVSRKVIDIVGLMPEEYFLYYEEHDWSTRIQNAGYKIYYQPKSVVYHKESASINKQSALKTYYITRNRILYMRKNFRGIDQLLPVVYILLISIPKNTIMFLAKWQFNHLRAYWRGIIWNLSIMKIK